MIGRTFFTYLNWIRLLFYRVINQLNDISKSILAKLAQIEPKLGILKASEFNELEYKALTKQTWTNKITPLLYLNSTTSFVCLEILTKLNSAYSKCQCPIYFFVPTILRQPFSRVPPVVSRV